RIAPAPVRPRHPAGKDRRSSRACATKPIVIQKPVSRHADEARRDEGHAAVPVWPQGADRRFLEPPGPQPGCQYAGDHGV
ncbi:hypothetical protein DQE80_17360, partial [Enterococcus sp. HPCN18]